MFRSLTVVFLFLSLGQWVLLPPAPFSSTTSKYYPVKLLSIEDMPHTVAHPGPHIKLEWYYGNMYPPRSAKPVALFPAHYCASIVAMQRDEFGLQEIPLSRVSYKSLICQGLHAD